MKNEELDLKKKDEISSLYFIYSSLLTEVIRRRIEAFYVLDFSLSEIAQNENVSRNAIFESILSGEKKLLLLEKKMQLKEKSDKLIENLRKIKESKNLDEIYKLADEIEGDYNYGI